MPRPGPRPYECVRRAWHSDRHQPIRGSIIQQIFRVVTEAHSSTTRKNREWQEKFPRVVFKAEEIMYSKANSEAEYTDPETLWERLNDAINTIIRRDESTETGQFLQPCIEAALILGCVPVRASRSQRHINPRSYLNPRFQEPAQAVLDTTDSHRLTPQPPTPSTNQLNLSRSTMANQASSIPISSSQTGPNTSCVATHCGPHLHPSFPRPMPPTGIESNTSLNCGSVYPLYYGSQIQNIDSQFRFWSPQNVNQNNIIIGKPVGWHAALPARFASTRSLLPGECAENEADELRQVQLDDSHEKAAEKGCDLSLRLGPSDPCTIAETRLADVTHDGGSSSHQESSKFSESYAKDLEFRFFHGLNSDEPSELCNNRLEQVVEVEDKNVTSRKRKSPYHHELDNGRTKWLLELHSDQFDGEIRCPDP